MNERQGAVADLEIHIFLHQQDNGHRGHNEDELQ
jgi:hypothetical protein